MNVDGLLGDVLADQPPHRGARAVEQRLARRLDRCRAEPVADLHDPALGGAAAADHRHQVAAVGVRRARVVEDHGERGLVQRPASTILIGGIRRPSSQIEVASLTWLPATLPPTSIM